MFPDNNGTKVGGLLGGGAPNSPLIAGALSAMLDQNATLDALHTSGAGALVGAYYVAPKNGDPQKTLYSIVNNYVADPIYRFCPIDYKVWYKVGPWSEMMYRFGQAIPRYQPDRDGRINDPWKRLYNDSLDFWISAMTPTTLNYFSKGLCAHMPATASAIDFEALKKSAIRYYLSAYDLNKKELKIYDNQQVDMNTFLASFSMAYFYPPYRMGSDLYTEGATHDPLGVFSFLSSEEGNIDIVLAFDLITDAFYRPPKNILDALGLLVMQPLVVITRLSLLIYLALQEISNYPPLYIVPFQLTPAEKQNLLSWSYSNGVRLYNCGYKSGQQFMKDWLAGNQDKYLYENFIKTEHPQYASLVDRLFQTLSKGSLKNLDHHNQ